MSTINLKGWQRVLIFIIPYIFVVGIFQSIGLFIAGVDYNSLNLQPSTEQQIIISLFDLVGTLLVVWIVTRLIDKENFISLGFNTKNRLKDFVLGVVVGLLIMSLGLFLLLQLNEIIYLNVVLKFKDLILTVFVFLIVAIVEEVLFRGYVLRNLMYSFDKYVALIITSLLFSLMHGFNPNMDWFSYTSLFLAGILLGMSYIYTKNLWFPIAIHFSWNFFQSLFGFNVSGQDFYSLIEFEISKNNLLNGGDFGFEGSILSVIAQVIVIAGVVFYYNKKTKKRSLS